MTGSDPPGRFRRFRDIAYRAAAIVGLVAGLVVLGLMLWAVGIGPY